MNYDDALSFLDRFVDFERRQPDEYDEKTFYIERVEQAARELGNPQDTYPSVHVAGTKGKGSVCRMLEQLFAGLGGKTGVFLSPHIREVRERIRIDGASVARSGFADGMEDLNEKLLEQAEPDEVETYERLTYFEWLTLLAFYLFDGEDVDLGIFETGMGGRLDSTNILNPNLSIITTLGLDHTEHLGETIEEIAREKAGIIKEGKTVLTSAEPGRGLEVIENEAQSKNADLLVLNRDFAVTDRIPQSGSGTGQKVELSLHDDRTIALHLSIPGKHQAENLALVVQGIALLCDQDLARWNPGVLGSATRQMSLPGRFQVLHRRPPVILDAAHNPLSCRALVEALNESDTGFPENRNLLFAAASDKDWREMLNLMVPEFRTITVTGYSTSRAEEPANIKQWLEQNHPDADVRITPDPGDFVSEYCNRENQTEPLVVAGSFYLIGDVLEKLENGDDTNQKDNAEKDPSRSTNESR